MSQYSGGLHAYQNGINNENELLEAINNKKYSELSEHLQKMIRKMFPKVWLDDLIIVKKVPGFAKADLEFIIHDEHHYLSVKYGNSAQVHTEKLSTFFSFLKEHQFSDELLNNIALYHYGDETTNGTGTYRMNQQEVMRNYASIVEKINEELNLNRYFVRDFVKRVVFIGNDPSKQAADFIYHGDIEEGEICSMESVLQYTKRKTFHRIINAHIGQIMFRPYARYSKGLEKHPEKRHVVVFEWSHLLWDLEFINQWKY